MTMRRLCLTFGAAPNPHAIALSHFRFKAVISPRPVRRTSAPRPRGGTSSAVRGSRNPIASMKWGRTGRSSPRLQNKTALVNLQPVPALTARGRIDEFDFIDVLASGSHTAPRSVPRGATLSLGGWAVILTRIRRAQRGVCVRIDDGPPLAALASLDRRDVAQALTTWGLPRAASAGSFRPRTLPSATTSSPSRSGAMTAVSSR
jgi:hypothetical protein